MKAEQDGEIVALDIGGSRIKAALVQEGQRVVLNGERITPTDDLELFRHQIAELIRELTDKVRAISVSITGVISPQTKKIKCANIPCVDGLSVQQELETQFGVPVQITNDADCFVLAEANSGAGRGHDNAFGIILGSGVGGGWVVEEKLVSGGGGYIGEWGHGSSYSSFSEFWPHPIPLFSCACGNKGCLNTIGGARGIEHLHQYLFKQNLDSKQIVDLWLEGDNSAATTIRLMSDLMSNQLALVLNVTGATIVPVGGGLANVGELIELLDEQVRSKMLHQIDQPIVVRSEWGDEAGLAGAAILGMKSLQI